MSMISCVVLSRIQPEKVLNSRIPSMKFPTSRFPLASSHPASPLQKFISSRIPAR